MSDINFPEWITAFSTSIGIWFLYKQASKLNEQLTIQQFSDYTKRYQEITLNFPEDINSKDFKLSKDRNDYDKTMRYLRAYLDLCYEEWYLNERGLIDGHIWDIWHGGMKTAFSKQAFIQAWNIIQKESDFGEKFHSFISDLAHSHAG